jgi:hypothetical protein
MNTTTKLNRRLALFTAIVMALTLWTALPLPASADEEVDGVYTNPDGFAYTLVEPDPESGGPVTAAITDYTGVETDMEIPDFVAGSGEDANIPVTAIAADAFQSATSLLSITIPKGLTNIATTAFNSCSALTAISVNEDNPNYMSENGILFNKNKTTLMRYPQAKTDKTYATPDTVTSVGGHSFRGCTSLEELTMLEGVTRIGGNAFNGSTSLKTVTIPEGVTSIDAYLFLNCTVLTSVTIPSTVTRIDIYAFQGCSSLEQIALPKNLESIGNRAFHSCSDLAAIAIPDSVTSIGAMAFVNCTSLTSVRIPDGVTIIEDNTFNSSGLEEVTIPDGVTSIGGYAFAYSYLETIALPKNLKTIGASAFAHSSLLASVTIPDGVTSIGVTAFYNCTSLTDVTVLSKNATIDTNTFGNCSSLARIWLYDDLQTNLRTWANDNSKTVIMVEAPVLNKTNLGLVSTDDTGISSDTLQVASYLPASQTETTTGANTPSVDWTSSDSSIAAVGKTSGKVTGVNYGTATITATITPHSGIPSSETCEVVVAPPASITSFKIGDAEGVITNDPQDDEAGTIDITVPYGTALTSVVPDIVHNGKAADGISPTDAQDFTDETPVTYTVTAENDATREYTVNVTIAPPVITSFTIGEAEGVITNDPDNEANTIDIEVPYNAELASLSPVIETGGNATVDPESGTEKDFTQNDTYTVSGDDDFTRVYTVNVTLAPAITGFAFDGVTAVGDIDINYDAGTITAEVPYNANLAELTPIITTNTGATAIPASGTMQDFSDPENPVTYTVTGANGVSTKTYTVTVTLQLSPENDITSFTVAGKTANIDGTDITVTVPYGTNITSIVPTIEISPKASVSPESGTPNDFSTDATYTVTSESGVENVYTVTVTVGPAPPPPTPTTYAVTVTGGTGSGDYEEGATVSITANAAEDSKVFDTWTSSGVILADATKESTSFTMPANAVTVTANYKDDPNAGGGDDPDDSGGPTNPNDPDDPPQTDTGWVKNEDGEWEYLTNGEAETGWLYDANYKAWFYLGTNGTMQTGWEYDDGAWYYLASNGKMKTGWVKDDGSWYYLAGSGAMVAAKWLHDTDGSWFYLSGNGKMLTGKQIIGGKTYTFKSNGVWIG